MSNGENPIPQGFHTITPYLYVQNAAKAIDFYCRAFSAKEHVRIKDAEGRIRHAELEVGDSRLFLTDVPIDPEMQAPSPEATSSVWLYLFVPDPDAIFVQAVSAGAEAVTPVGDQVWGDRYGCVADPFGYRWGIARRVENLTPEELTQRMAAVYRDD